MESVISGNFALPNLEISFGDKSICPRKCRFVRVNALLSTDVVFETANGR